MSIATYPTIDRVGSLRDWSEGRQMDTVLESTPRPGLKIKDVLRSFDPITFTHKLLDVSDAGMSTLKTFYNTNKSKEIYWTHPRTLVTYIVMFDVPYIWQANNDIDSWNVVQQFTQSSGTVS